MSKFQPLIQWYKKHSFAKDKGQNNVPNLQTTDGVVELSGGFFAPVSSPVNSSKQESLSKNEVQCASQGRLDHAVDIAGQDAKWQQKVMSHYDDVEFC